MESRHHPAEHREDYTASGLCSSATLRGAVSPINGRSGEKGTRRARWLSMIISIVWQQTRNVQYPQLR